MDYKSDVLNFVERYVNNRNERYNDTQVVYDAPVYEEYNGMVFIYFTTQSRDDIENKWFWKKYHQLVIGCLFIEIYYEDSNMIDVDKNYPLSDVRLKFKNRCKHFLKKLE
jgi:hypothetical protein